MNTQAEEHTGLMEELIRLEKKELRFSRLTALAGLALAAVLLVAVAVLAPRAVALIEHMERSLSEIDTLAADAGTTLSKTGDTIAEVDKLVRNANTVVVDNTEAVNEAVTKLNNVDFDSLNEAIGGLATAVEPLVRFADLFH